MVQYTSLLGSEIWWTHFEGMDSEVSLFFTFFFVFSTKLSLISITLVTMVTRCHFEILRLFCCLGVIPASHTKNEKNPRCSVLDPYGNFLYSYRESMLTLLIFLKMERNNAVLRCDGRFKSYNYEVNLLLIYYF